MTDYSELVKALRRCDMKQGCFNANCRYSVGKYFCDMDKVHKDAAAAIEALQAELERKRTADCWGCKCEKMEPKRGEIVRCGECKHGLKIEFGNIWCNDFHCEKHTPDWYCADGERREG